MTKDDIKRKVTIETLLSVKQTTGQGFLPAAVSNRHLHLTRADVDRLFGAGYKLTPKSALSQPGQFACEETVTVIGPKGKLEKVRVLGPERPETQIELSISDAFKIGIQPVVRMSGDIKNTPGATIEGPCGQVAVPNGVIVAARHLHLSDAQAAVFGLRSGDVIRVKTAGERAVVFENVRVRVNKNFDMELHFDFDEANCTGLRNGDIVEIV
ncbi:MAG: phosphate propanoyltransferase [Oscillospiraceae bacterium]|nr:phosphate propanoyltransferase [Oscillospiraceae bacterium]